MQSIDTSCETALLDTSEKVYGIIYEMTNVSNGMKYVGQTVSHRLNRGKYRPFGMMGRFNDHVSEAINNTKKKQCSFLNNAIRKYGRESFTVELVELCVIPALNDREQLDGKTASFTSKTETIEQSKERAIAFIKDIHNATLSNCGKPVKHE